MATDQDVQTACGDGFDAKDFTGSVSAENDNANRMLNLRSLRVCRRKAASVLFLKVIATNRLDDEQVREKQHEVDALTVANSAELSSSKWNKK